MYMTAIFFAAAIVAGLGGVLMPHAVFRLGFFMMTVYLILALATALLNLARRNPRRTPP